MGRQEYPGQINNNVLGQEYKRPIEGDLNNNNEQMNSGFQHALINSANQHERNKNNEQISNADNANQEANMISSKRKLSSIVAHQNGDDEEDLNNNNKEKINSGFQHELIHSANQNDINKNNEQINSERASILSGNQNLQESSKTPHLRASIHLRNQNLQSSSEVENDDEVVNLRPNYNQFLDQFAAQNDQSVMHKIFPEKTKLSKQETLVEETL